MDKKLKKIVMLNPGKAVKINYETLKKHLSYEDYFYENVLMPVAKDAGLVVSFSGEFVILKPKEEK